MEAKTWEKERRPEASEESVEGKADVRKAEELRI